MPQLQPPDSSPPVGPNRDRDFVLDPRDADAIERAVLDREGKPISGGEIRFRCPTPEHSDVHPSARYNPDKHVWHCDSCGAGDGVVALAELLGVMLTPPSSNRTNNGGFIATYEYHDEAGVTLHRIGRTANKKFVAERPDGKGGWLPKITGVRTVLYKLPNVTVAVELGLPVVGAEGEKDANSLTSLGLCGTSAPFGASQKFKPEWADSLQGAIVRWFIDNDEDGRRHGKDVAQKCAGKVASFKILTPPAPHKDVSDWIAAGATREDIERLADEAPEWVPGNSQAVAPSFEGSDPPSSQPAWPAPMEAAAFHGLAGEFVALVEPYTEADPVALLSQFLVAAGSVFGRGAHFSVAGGQHYPNLFAVLVGETSKARKGTSWTPTNAVLRLADPDWQTSSGLSSGEGLISAVRDPAMKREPVKDHGRVVSYQDVEIDSGVLDKRLLVIQPEFASTLHVMERDEHALCPHPAGMGRRRPKCHDAGDAEDEPTARDRRAHQPDRSRDSRRAASLPRPHRDGQRVRQPDPVGLREAVAHPSGRRWD